MKPTHAQSLSAKHWSPAVSSALLQVQPPRSQSAHLAAKSLNQGEQHGQIHDDAKGLYGLADGGRIHHHSREQEEHPDRH